MKSSGAGLSALKARMTCENSPNRVALSARRAKKKMHGLPSDHSKSSALLPTRRRPYRTTISARLERGGRAAGGVAFAQVAQFTGAIQEHRGVSQSLVYTWTPRMASEDYHLEG